ncbi:uncharacterized protein [Parasteatoda tepidariorum]|uniref:uncharacterized protein n=1 Tax=Parasteatoda tepidariorum TaxID=114398 RepID=UPI0039BCB398
MIRKRKDGFVNYGLDALRNSMVTGIPQIIDATNTPNKILRLLVLVSCLAGFMYQSSDFMDLYWQYKTITDVKVQTTKVAELPSITVCNLNGLYGSRICNDSRFMANCFKSRIDQRSCACFGERFCNNGVPEVIQCVHMKIYDDIKEMKYEDYRMLLQKREEFISNCRLIKLDEKKIFDCDLSYYQHVRCPSSYSGVVEGCYTLNTIIGWPEKKPMTIPTEGIYSFSVFPHAEEYPQYWGVVSAQLSIHSPRQIVNPFTDGFNMNLNTEQTFRLKKVVKKLLPAPYETNCIDYIEMWKKRGGHGPTNQKECFEECQKNISIQFRGCVSSYYNFPRNERTCSSTVRQLCSKEDNFKSQFHFGAENVVEDRVGPTATGKSKAISFLV